MDFDAYQKTGDTVQREYWGRLVVLAGVALIPFFLGRQVGAVLWWLALACLLALEVALYKRFLAKGRPLLGAERQTLAAVSFICSSVNVWPAYALLTVDQPPASFAAALFMAGTLLHLLVHNSENRLIFCSAAAPLAIGLLGAGGVAALDRGEFLPLLTASVFLYAMGMAFLAKESASRKIAAAIEEAERERAAAIKASAAKSAFLARMSHELRTPLNGVLGSAAALKGVPLSGDDADRLAAIEASGEALLALVSDVIDITSIETGGLTLSEGPTDLRETICAVVARYRALAAEKGLGLGLDLGAVHEQFVLVDGARLGQALSHLLSNSVKFTENGAILVRARADNGEGLIEVSDTGCGLSAEEQERIFRPFEQADNSITRKYGGAGLGLALVAEIAKAMGGAVSVKSEKGKGAAFTLSFKAPPASATPAAAVAPEASKNGPAILLVEDNEINRKVVRAFLRPLNADIVDAENGAVALARLSERAFDVVLMDLHMPVMDGLTTTRAIRAAPASYAATPIIALTAAVSEEDRRASFAAGVDEFLGKPVKGDKLAATIRRFTGDRLAAEAV
jgi:signal transduction histidine kinase/ActR/RegA family two-component response regulator